MCKNEKHLAPDLVHVHILKKGFTPRYWYWTSHGEEAPQINLDVDMNSATACNHQHGNFDIYSGKSSGFRMGNLNIGLGGPVSTLRSNYDHVNRYQGMVCDVANVEFGQQFERNVEEPPNMGAATFFELLNSAQQPLWPGCENHSELSTALRMLSLKCDYNMAHGCFDEMAQLMKEISHPENRIPPTFYRAKKLVSGLGLTSQKIDCCKKGCMLYYKEDRNLRECKFCQEPHYEARKSRT